MNKKLILEEARHWLSSEQEGLELYSNEEFLSWLNTSLEHKQIFEEEKEFRNKIFSLSSKEKEKLSEKTKQELKRARAFKNIKILIPLAACILITFVFLFKPKEIYTQEFFTENKIQKLKLPDKSKILLDAKTKIKVAFSDEKREVFLEEGRVLFKVSSNKDRPFLVRNNSIIVHVVGTKFEVSKEKEKVNISVLEGAVAIRYGEDEYSKIITHLEKGDILDISNFGKVNSMKKVSLSKIANWKDEKVVFNQTSLTNAIKEFSKYTNKEIDVNLNSSNIYPITGEFSLYGIDKFLEYLPLIYPLKIEKNKNKIKILEKKS
ncbi:FecR family protein [Halarcobacter mediterraneus]|uniref:FecR family protein n=1 Tax=Halarcobacter mediterraneus TaxID=2023153 RepID=UPI0019D6CEFF|nr:FecR domain-containing protein [Halarcobacter mediterraneus]